MITRDCSDKDDTWTRARHFTLESFWIEGIDLFPSERSEILRVRVQELLWLSRCGFGISPSIYDVCIFAERLGGNLRVSDTDRVRVGDHVAPPGGPHIETALRRLMDEHARADPVAWHHRFLHLHPFTDGNGHTGRALWWCRVGPDLPFLRSFYYRVLERMDRSASSPPPSDDGHHYPAIEDAP